MPFLAVLAVAVAGACLPALPAGGLGHGSAAGPAAAPWVAPLRAPTTLLRGFAPPPPGSPWRPGHRGVDLAAAVGAPVLADGAGVVTMAGPVAGTPVVVVDHGGTLRSTFEPVEATVRVGAQVRPGDVLGRLTAWWSEPLTPDAAHCGARSCLHWGMIRGGWYVDPLVVAGLGAGCRQVRLLPLAGPRPPSLAEPAPLVPGRRTGAASPTARPGGVAPLPVERSPWRGAAVTGGVALAAAGAAVPTVARFRRRRWVGPGRSP
jgi:murein DD-endopeptidase MepM/ murein hydrolase activator NlpD